MSVKETFLHAHNAVRALHEDTPPLTWSDSLAASAESWVLTIAAEGSKRHSDLAGENIARAASGIPDTVYTPAKAVFQW